MSLRSWTALFRVYNIKQFETLASPEVYFGRTRKNRCKNKTVRCFHQNSNVRSFEEIPGPRGIHSIPYLGLVFQLQPFSEFSLDDITKLHDHWYTTYGPLVRVRMGSSWMCHVFHPHDIETIYRSDGKYPRRVPLPLSEAYYRRKNIPPGMVVLNGEAWWEQRRAIQSVVQRPSVMKQYVPLLSKIADEFVEKFKGETVIKDIFHHLMEFTVEGISLLLFNKRLGCIDDSNTRKKEIMYHSEVLLDSFGKQYKHPPSYFKFRSKLYNQYEESSDYLRNIAQESLTEMIEKLKASTNEDDIEANATMLLLRDGNPPLELLKSTLLDLFAGGIDTTAGATTFVLIHLAKYQDKQEKLYNEVKDVVTTTITADDLQKMPYLKACVKESFRMVYPIPGGAVRMLDKDIVLSGYHVPKNTPLQICSGTASRDEKYFPKPDQFLPERWIREDSERKVHSFVFVPFGHGPRNCVGQRFAETEIHVLIAKLVKNYRIMLPEHTEDIGVKYTTFARPSVPVNLILQERD